MGYNEPVDVILLFFVDGKTCVIVELTITLGVEWDVYVLEVIENMSWMDDSGYFGF